MFDQASLDEAIQTLGDILEDRGERFELVAIGGGGLLLIGLIQRPTKDLDLVALRVAEELVSPTPLPAALAVAVGEVAELLELDPTWLNGGPGSLMRFGLPVGFFERCHTRDLGGIVLHLASRYDQIHFKLYAAADDAPNGKHHVDLEKLAPSHEELHEAAHWARTHDPSEGFATMLAGVLGSFGI